MKHIIIVLFALALTACGSNGSNTDSGGDTATLPAPPIETSAPPPPAKVIDVTGEACGGIAAVQCPSGFYCEQPKGQCLEMMDGAGTCQVQSEICTKEYRPVCGCDGQTYSNACMAGANGASIASDGECATLDTQ